MKENSLFILVLLFVSSLLISIPVSAQELVGETPIELNQAIELLQSEISRDQTIVQSKMNIARLRQTRQKLATGVQRKEALLEWFAEPAKKQYPQVVNILLSTLQDEKNIVASGQTTQRIKRLTQNRLTQNILRKQNALTILTSHQ